MCVDCSAVLRCRGVGCALASAVSPPCLKAHSHWCCLHAMKGETVAGYVCVLEKSNTISF